MDLSEALLMRDAAGEAYRQALAARSTSFGDKSVTRQDLKTLRDEYNSWCRIVNDLQRSAIGSNRPPVAAIARWTR